MRALVLAILLSISLWRPGLAQTDTLSVGEKIHYDQRQGLQPVHFDKNQIETYKNDPDFDYSLKLETTNWWEAFTNWVAYWWHSFWQSILSNIDPGSWLTIVIEILKYVVIIALIGFAVWLFIRLNPGRAFMKPKTPPEVLLSDEEKIIKEKDIPQLIKQALNAQNYRLAVRYSYLLILKTLKEKRLIDYQFQKTNQEYQAEIKDAKIAGQFENITRLYDFIWYGDFAVNKKQYHKAQKAFKALQTQLKNTPNVEKL